ncbi:AlpA family transcriptional regulator [Nocardiopsis sp. L17-MgMaSL7]|uniref:helix-turn-helix transcriptional regulator n=1 Tax=Nocardiopsis sp. L17-MgMaSL7 TaxID=1938893 RepID=UPI000D70B0AD|nr:helix-turn-helix domain-containing protein [Nocardiopsis sp. L17-MgMaSL7]
MIEGYLSSKDVAERLGVKVATVHEYRARGTLPPPDEIVGRSPLWKKATIDAWEESRPGQDWRKGG